MSRVSYIKSIFGFTSLFIIFYLLIFSCLYFIHFNKTPLLFYVAKELTNLEDTHAGKSLSEFTQNDNSSPKYDFIVLGSSQAYRGYDPRIFDREGYKMHNLGTSSQRFDQTYLLANELLDSNVTRTVILDMYLGGFVGDKLESALNLIQSVPSDKLAARIAAQAKDLRMINALTLRFFDSLFKNKDQREIMINYYHDATQYVSGGFAETLSSARAVIEQDRVYKRSSSIDRILKRLLESLEKKGIRTYIIMAPQPKGFLPRNKEEFFSDVQKIANEFPNTEALNFSWKLDLDTKDHFFDHRHLNQRGVEIFNKALFAELKKNKEF